MSKLTEKLKKGVLHDLFEETRWIYKYARRYRGSIILYLFLGLFSTLLGLFSSIATKYALDGILNRNMRFIAVFGVFYIVSGVLKICLSSLLKRFSHRISLSAQNRLRANVFSRVLTIDWQASLDYHSGDLLSRIQSDVSTVSESILGWIPNTIICGFQFLGALVIILIYDPIMAVIALVSLPFTLLVSRIFVKKLRSYGQKLRADAAMLTSFYEETLSNLQAVKAFHLNKNLENRLLSLQQLYWNTSIDYNLFSVHSGFLLQILGFVSGTLCLVWGVYEMWTGKISAGSMVLFIQLAGTLATAFSSLISIIPSIISSSVSSGRIMKILELPMENTTVTQQEKELMAIAKYHGVTVSANHIFFTYGDRAGKGATNIFSNFSFTAAPSEIIGIIGASGDGKTTLLRLLLNLLTPHSGTLTVSSGDLVLPTSVALRPLFSIVTQEKYMTTGTLRDILSLAKHNATDKEMYHALDIADIGNLFRSYPTGLDTMISEKGGGFSEGQIQRIAIARAVLQDAPVMLLDEATSALDLETEKRVIENLVSISKNKTIIVTTHRPQVLDYCTRVYRI